MTLAVGLFGFHSINACLWFAFLGAILVIFAVYASHLIAMKDGAIVVQGRPSAIVTEKLVEDVFGLPSVIVPDPVANTPLIVPKGRHRD